MMLLLLLLLSAAHFSAAANPINHESPSKNPVPQFHAIATANPADSAPPPFPQFSATSNPADFESPASPPVPHFNTAANPADFESQAPPLVPHSTAVSPADFGSPAKTTCTSNSPVELSAAVNPLNLESPSKTPVPHISAAAAATATDPATPPVPHFSAAANPADFGSPAKPPVPPPSTSNCPVDLSAASNPAVFLIAPPSTSPILPDEIWDDILLALRPEDQLYAQFVCKKWRGTLCTNLEGFKEHINWMNSKENRARIFQIEELLLFLLITETNLEKYNQHPLGKIPRNIQLIEQFKENNPNIVPIEWDHDKMLQFYYDQVEFKEPKGPVQISSNATWIEKDFRFRVEERERPRKRELFLFFILGMAFYFWTGWQEKKSSTKKQGKSKKGSPGKGKKGDGKKGPPGKGREGGTRGY